MGPADGSGNIIITTATSGLCDTYQQNSVATCFRSLLLEGGNQTDVTTTYGLLPNGYGLCRVTETAASSKPTQNPAPAPRSLPAHLQYSLHVFNMEGFGYIFIHAGSKALLPGANHCIRCQCHNQWT